MASAEALARAIEYPYVRPVSTGHSYIFINGQVYSFRNEAWTGIQGLEGMMVNPQHHCKPVSSKDAVSTSCPPIRAKEAALQHGFDLEASVQCTNWLPVLAVGSNAAPQCSLPAGVEGGGGDEKGGNKLCWQQYKLPTTRKGGGCIGWGIV
eukprot:1154264-Pelagomonas_calceolata.AAC.9